MRCFFRVTSALLILLLVLFASALAEEERKVAELAKRESAARTERAFVLRKAGEALQRGGKACGIAVGGLADELFAAGDGDFADAFESVNCESFSAREAKADEVRRFAREVESRTADADALRGELDALRRRGEAMPAIAGFAWNMGRLSDMNGMKRGIEPSAKSPSVMASKSTSGAEVP